MLFDKIRVMITEVNIAQAIIMVELVNKLSKDVVDL
jgi:ribonuclease R